MDETLQEFWVRAKAEPTEAKDFIVRDEILYRVVNDGDRDEQKWQLVVPSAYRTDVLKLAHNSPMGGHMGRQRTTDRILERFFWPNVYLDVAKHCQQCHDCQMTARKRQIEKVPLKPLPIIETPFHKIGMDLVGPLERSKTRFK